jgi:hypothetical protein
MGSSKGVTQVEGLEKPGEGGTALVNFFEKVWERKKGQGLGVPCSSPSPTSASPPPTGDSPLQPFIYCVSHSEGQAGRGQFMRGVGGLHFELKEGLKTPENDPN